MKKQSSYIFLQHPSKEKKQKNEDGTIVIEIGNNVYGFISRTFPSVTSIGDKSDIFDKQFKGDIYACSVIFTIHDVASVEYLDISVEGNTAAKTIGCLEQIQSELFNSGIRNYYVDIVSYDAISEYYCNKIAVKLNNLERNLRKLLFNIYILNFGENYYKATMSSNLQSKIKSLINSTTTKEQKDRIKTAYNVSSKEAESIARLQQFFYSFELADMQSFLFEPNWTSMDEEEKSMFLSKHSDLSELSDEELRTAFSHFTPKSDWDRFFSAKIPINNITDLINNIRKYRNSVAHFKYFDSDDYKCCSKLIRQFNKAINEATKITEDVDFAEKNTEMIKEALSGLAERMNKIKETIVAEIQRNFEKTIQPLVDALGRLKTMYNPFIQSKSDVIGNNNQEKDDYENAKDDESNNH
jgi:hypothetical protein